MDYVYAVLGITVDVGILASFANGLGQRRSWWQALGVYIIYGAAVLIMNAGGFSVVIKIPICILMIYVLLGVVYEHSKRGRRIGIAILYIIILGIPELLTLFGAILFSAGLNSVDDLNSNPDVWFFLMAISKICTYLFALLIVKIYRSSQIVKKRFWGIVQYGPLIAAWFLLMTMAFILINSSKIKKDEITVVLIATIIAIFLYTLAHIVFIRMYFEFREKEYENQALRQKNELQYKYYSNKLQLEGEMQKVYHDLKNYTLMLHKRKLEITGLECKINRLTKSYSNFINTGNEMLNIILSEKERIAEHSQILLSSIIRIPDWCCLSDMEICVVFGNLIDNAIEASMKVEKVEKRKITVKGYMKNENALVIKISNNYIKPVMKREDKYGIGLSNVKDIIQKHEGHISFHTSGELFIVSILFYRDVLE